MKEDPPRIPDPWRWKLRSRPPRSDPREDEIGIGNRHPLLGWLGVWILGIAAIVGLSFLLPERTEGIVAIVVLIGLLTTVRI
jgi:hypothetical protein